LDGVYVYRDNRPPRFQHVKAPNKDELEDLVQLISQRAGRCLERQGLLEQDTGSAWLARIANTEVRSPPERHVAMSWAQRLTRVFNIDIEVCGRCGGAVKVNACIEDQDVIDKILADLRDMDPTSSTLPLLIPPSRAPPGTLPLFAGKGAR
jgi:hypothetical protein